VGSIIKVKNVTKTFNGQRILYNISFNVFKGEVLGIIGESGTGKTTLLRILIGFLNSDGGTISYRFKRTSLSLNVLKKEKTVFYKLLGFSTQNCSFYPNLTVYDNIALYGVLNGLKKDELTKKINHMLRIVKLFHKKDELAVNLSAGMQKQLDIACSLVYGPKIIFLDEPTAHLDSKNRKVIWNLVKKMKTKGATVVISSHFSRELKRICDRIYLLKNKKLIKQNV